MASTKRKPRPTAETAAATVILAAFRHLQAEVADFALRFERYERQCDANVRRCAEMQADLDTIKKLLRK